MLALFVLANLALSGYLGIEQFDFFIPRVCKENTFGGGTIWLEDVRSKAEKEAILQALSNSRGNKKLASEILRIDRSVLYDKIKKYGIKVENN